jgi:hypothetical protein
MHKPVTACLMAGALAAGHAAAHDTAALAGTWRLVAADVEYPDGRRGPDYGASPKGLLIVDADGRYSLQIFKSERVRFGAGDKAKGSEAEFRSAVLGSSTHYGRMRADPVAHTLQFDIEAASFPNWEGTHQVRPYTLEGDELTYRVAPRGDGGVPISVWRRVRAGAE